MPTFTDQRSTVLPIVLKNKVRWERIVEVTLPSIVSEMTTIRQQIIANKDGSFLPSDLDDFNALANNLIDNLQAYANSLPDL